MLPSANSLMSSGTALVFKYLTQLQVDAAEMEIDNQKLMKTLLQTAPAMLQGGLDFANKQANDQIQSGWVQLGDGLASAFATVGTSMVGAYRNPMPEESGPQVKADLEEESSETAVIEGATNSSSRSSTAAGDETAEIRGRTKTEATTKKEASETEEDTQKALTKKQEAALAERNFYNNVCAPQLGGVLSSAFKTATGYVQAKVTQDAAQVQFAQGVSQMMQGVVSQTSANIQSKEQQEKTAADALIQVEQLAGFRA